MSTINTPKNSKAINEHNLRVYFKIVDFVTQLYDCFGQDKNFHEIELYNHLLSKTGVNKKVAIQRHVELFTDFIVRNSDAITLKDYKKIVSSKISYSEKVYLDISKLFNQDLDRDTLDSIWNHLLVIQATIDPNSKAKDVLKAFSQSHLNDSTEGKFLNNFLQKVETSIGQEDNSNPMAAASSLLQGGLLNDLVSSIDSGVKNGNIDLGKLVGTVQNMLGGLTGQMGGSGEGNPMGDLGGIMNMFGSMMGQMKNTSSSSGITGMNPDNAMEQIQARVEAEKNRVQASISEVSTTSSEDVCTTESCNIDGRSGKDEVD